MLFFLLTAAVAICGGLIAMRMKLPAGAMIGSMLAVAALNIATGQVHIMGEAKMLTQTIAGAFIGLNMTRDTVKQLKMLIAPAIFMAIFMQCQGVIIGLLIHRFSPVDLVTALIASSPGGIVDMSLIAIDMNADTATVAVLHTVRLMLVILLFPQIIGPVSSYFQTDEEKLQAQQQAESRAAAPVRQTEDAARPTRWEVVRWNIRKSLPTFLVAAVGGYIGSVIGIPAGVILFSMVAVSAYSIGSHKGFLPVPLRRAAQILAGALIGQNIGMEQVLQLRMLVVPALIIICVYITGNLVGGLVLRRFFKIDLVTGMFASSPAGASDLALIAADLGAQGPSVAVLHIVRLVSVIAFYPQLVTLLVYLMG